MSKEISGAAGELAKHYPAVWDAYAALGAATARSGGLSDRERRLVKLALAIGAGSEGAVHSHSRRALEQGVPVEDLHQIAFLAIGPLGFPRGIAAWTWIVDITDNT